MEPKKPIKNRKYWSLLGLRDEMWVEEMTEGGQRVQTSSYKINKILVRMVSRVEYIVHVSKSCWSRFEKFSPHIQKHGNYVRLWIY